ncbi:aldehyde dehydrogenase family protein [Burkholderia sp. S171]|uniref:aldehyde dehydrogenase family protein n=1 Tax=Burkholderia sp. S171 TaxID=1641860 RepID=UPI00131BF3C5|nr:aldehyde dehydrogenase family protein [Burkholderia sp. S171]
MWYSSSDIKSIAAARIDGRAAVSGEAPPTTPVLSASTGEVLAWQHTASQALINDAVVSATVAFRAWRKTSPAERGAILRSIADLVNGRREELARLQMLVSGKPRLEAVADVNDVIATFAYYADLCFAGSLFTEVSVAIPEDAIHAASSYDAIGVAALIIPWNFPMVTTAWKVAPALAAGCTVVLKPSELTSLAEDALIDVFDEAGVPPGVVNVVNGGANVGAALVAHPDVAKISFTGSSIVGKKVLLASAERMTRLTLELGGKSSLIVCEDADLEDAVALAVAGAFTNAGQMCSATSRILVHSSLYDDFMARFEAVVKSMVVGPPSNPKSQMGPLVSAAQLSRVANAVADGLQDGARLAFSGTIDDQVREGFFLAPQVIADPDIDNVLWRDEIFGPVACVKPFQSDEEAIGLANDTQYGLVATVVTRDAARAEHMRAELRVGLVWINTPQLIFPQTSWGGMGQSGIGRELGIAGLRSYQELRHVVRPR